MEIVQRSRQEDDRSCLALLLIWIPVALVLVEVLMGTDRFNEIQLPNPRT